MTSKDLKKEQKRMLETQKERVLRAASRWAEVKLLNATLESNGLHWIKHNFRDSDSYIEILLDTLKDEAKELVTMRALFSRAQEPGKLQF